jgi:hypothetical protein
MLSFFLFLFYLIAGTWILHRIVRRSGLPFSPYHTAAAVCFKVLMGCLYGYIFLHYYRGDDTWMYFNDSKPQTGLLLTNPQRFIGELLPGYSVDIHAPWWANARDYIYYFEYWFFVKLLAVLNLFSGSNYYIDVLWFDLLTFAGPLILFTLLFRRFPQKAGLCYILVFFIPSVTFWCSGIRAEALILLFITLLLYNGAAYAQEKKTRHIAGMLAGLTGFLLFRYQYLIFFLPALAAYMFSVAHKRSGPVYFNRIYLALAVVFILSLFLPPRYQLSRPLIRTQQNFFSLHGNTRYALDSLQPGPAPVFSLLPQALANSSLRPYLWEGKGFLQLVFSAESLFLLAGLLFFAFGRQDKGRAGPLYWLFLYYSISQLLAIGYTIPFPGAIVRYRCIPFLFLFIFFFSARDLPKPRLTRLLFPGILNK